MKKTNLNSECKDLEFIIENLLTGKESCETEDSQYTPEDAIDYLQGFLQELNELNTQIIEQGNTPELLDCVFKKYTELWLFHFRLYSSCRLLSIELCRIKLQSDYKNQQKKELRRDGGQIVHCPFLRLFSAPKAVKIVCEIFRCGFITKCGTSFFIFVNEFCVVHYTRFPLLCQ